MNKCIAVLLLATMATACVDPKDVSPPTPVITKEAKGVAITLEAVEADKNVGSMGLVEPAPEGATYVHVTYTLKNTATKSLSLMNWPQARLVDPQGNELEPEIYASTALSAAAKASWGETLNPNLSTEAQLVWKVDELSFDRAKWKLRFLAKPALDFPLQ